MLRIALNGKISDTEKYTDLVLDQPGCILSGIFYQDLNSSFKGKLSDHPASIADFPEQLTEISDAVIFLGNTRANLNVIQNTLKRSKHVFIFPDSAISPEILKTFRKLADEAGVLFYLRHDILSPGFRELSGISKEPPEFIDIYRYTQLSRVDFSNQLFDLLQQEIMYLFSLNQVPLKRFESNIVPYYTDNPKFINLRFEFVNRSVANLSINMFTVNQSRYTEIYHANNMIRFNTSGKLIEIADKFRGIRKIEYDTFNLDDEKNIGQEISNFLHYLQNGYWAFNSFETGYQVFDTTWEVFRTVNPLKEEKN